MKPGAWYTVRQGESVESIAAHLGHLPETIWEDPENQSLRDRRKDPDVLMPGDRIFVPPVKPRTFEVRTGSPARFKIARPPPRLKVQMLKDGQPRANAPFRLTVDGIEERGTTDGEGRIDRPVAPRATRAVLVVGEGEEATEHVLELRALDPIDEVSGVQARLRNLGYDAGPTDGVLGPRTRGAIAEFQGNEGLDPTGEPDDATRSKLKTRHGV